MRHIYLSLNLLFLFCPLLAAQQDLIIKVQKSGPFLVNSYLIYDPVTRDGAFIDTGSKTDSLIYFADKENLRVKYIFLTHAHQDHIAGVNEIRNNYPNANLCMAIEEFVDFALYTGWRKLFDPKSVSNWQKDSAIVKLMDFNYIKIDKPEIILTDNKLFKLGKTEIRVIKTPGHSRGSVTFIAGSYIFPGDLILYNSTGYLDYSLCSKDEIVKSIRKLYNLLHDETVIYSGHGKSSSIGFEKVNNKNVTISKVTW